MGLFDDWNYDKFEQQRWNDGDYVISAEPDGKLYWATFNGNPAYFCGEVTAIGWEDFLAKGAQIETSASCLQAIRKYLETVRLPGRSTHAILGIRSARMPVFADWLLAGYMLARPMVVGPEGAGGSWDDFSSWKRERGIGWERVLLAPGEHHVSVKARFEAGATPEIERTIRIKQGERIELIVDVSL